MDAIGKNIEFGILADVLCEHRLPATNGLRWACVDEFTWVRSLATNSDSVKIQFSHKGGCSIFVVSNEVGFGAANVQYDNGSLFDDPATTKPDGPLPTIPSAEAEVLRDAIDTLCSIASQTKVAKVIVRCNRAVDQITSLLGITRIV